MDALIDSMMGSRFEEPNARFNHVLGFNQYSKLSLPQNIVHSLGIIDAHILILNPEDNYLTKAFQLNLNYADLHKLAEISGVYANSNIIVLMQDRFGRPHYSGHNMHLIREYDSNNIVEFKGLPIAKISLCYSPTKEINGVILSSFPIQEVL